MHDRLWHVTVIVAWVESQYLLVAVNLDKPYHYILQGLS